MKYIFFNHPVIYSINDASSPRRIETIMNTGILISGVDYDRLAGFHPTLKIRSKSNPNQREHVSPQFLCAPLLRESAHVCRNRIRKRGRPNSAWRACGSHDGPRDWMSKSELHNAWVTGTRRFSCRDRWESNAISCLEKKRKKKKERERGKDLPRRDLLSNSSYRYDEYDWCKEARITRLWKLESIE